MLSCFKMLPNYAQFVSGICRISGGLFWDLRFLGRTDVPPQFLHAPPFLLRISLHCAYTAPSHAWLWTLMSRDVVSKFQGMKEFMNWKVIDTEILPDNPMSLSRNKLSCLNVFDNKYQYWINNPTASKENDHWWSLVLSSLMFPKILRALPIRSPCSRLQIVVHQCVIQVVTNDLSIVQASYCRIQCWHGNRWRPQCLCSWRREDIMIYYDRYIDRF